MNIYENFIKPLGHNVYGKLKQYWSFVKGKFIGYSKRVGLKDKSTNLLWLIVNITVTGVIIMFIVYYWNHPLWRFLSYGLLSAIVMFYLKWLRKLSVAKTQTEIDEL